MISFRPVADIPICRHHRLHDARIDQHGTDVGLLAAGPTNRGLLACEGEVAAGALAATGTVSANSDHHSDYRYDATTISAAERLWLVDGRHDNDQPGNRDLGDARRDRLHRQPKERPLTTHRGHC